MPLHLEVLPMFLTQMAILTLREVIKEAAIRAHMTQNLAPPRLSLGHWFG